MNNDFRTRFEENPELRDQFVTVVGSLENLLHKLREVAAELKDVVNQIDDVTNKIEASHCGSKPSNLLSPCGGNGGGHNRHRLNSRNQHRSSLDSGFQEAYSLHDYVNINHVSLECLKKKSCKDKFLLHTFPEHIDVKENAIENGAQQSSYNADNFTSNPEIDKKISCDLACNCKRPKSAGPLSCKKDALPPLVEETKAIAKYNNPNHLSSSVCNVTRHLAMTKSTTIPCVVGCADGLTKDSTSDIYEKRFEEQLAQLDFDESFKLKGYTFRSVRGWGSSSALSDTLSYTDNCLDSSFYDEDNKSESDANSDNSCSNIADLKPSDTFKYRLRRQISARQKKKSPTWRIVIEP